MTTSPRTFAWRGTGALLAALALLATGAAPALAAPGGSSGTLRTTTPGPRIDPAESYREGVAALQEGDYREAEKKFGEVLSVARDHPEANYYMGLAKVGRGKEKSSVRYFKRAIKERSDFIEAREQLALVYVGLGDADEAAEQLEELKALQENCTTETCDQAFADRTASAIGKIETALAGAGVEGEEVGAAPADALHFAGLPAPSADTGSARYGAAVRLIHQERYGEAIATLYEAQAVYGPHPDILNYLGYSHRKTGDFEAAKTYYARALALDPDHRGATEYLGELYLEIGEIDRAREQLARLDALCTFGCPEREDLARLIEIKESARSAQR